MGASSSWHSLEQRKHGADAEDSPVDRTGSAESPAADPTASISILYMKQKHKKLQRRFSFRI